MGKREQLIQKNDTHFRKRPIFTGRLLRRQRPNIKQNEPNSTKNRQLKEVNLDPTRLELVHPAVATASRSPAEEDAPPPSDRSCMPPLPLPPG